MRWGSRAQTQMRWACAFPLMLGSNTFASCVLSANHPSNADALDPSSRCAWILIRPIRRTPHSRTERCAPRWVPPSVGEHSGQAVADVLIPAPATDVVAGEVRIQPVVGEAEDRAPLTWHEIEHAPGADPFVFAVDEPEFVLEDLPHHSLRPRFQLCEPGKSERCRSGSRTRLAQRRHCR